MNILTYKMFNRYFENFNSHLPHNRHDTSFRPAKSNEYHKLNFEVFVMFGSILKQKKKSNPK